jgi:hypothetical protein
MAGANAVFTIVAVYHWRPTQFRWTDEERLARGLTPRRSPDASE